MEKLLTFSEAAERCSISAAWWRKQAARGRIAVVKLGRATRLREDDVQRVIRDGLRPARPAAQS